MSAPSVPIAIIGMSCRFAGGATDPEKLADMSREQYVEMFGSEGAELMMWLVMRGAMDRDVVVRHKHYFVPASMTGAGMIVMENEADASPAVAA